MAFAVRALRAVRKNCRGMPHRSCFCKHAHSNSNSNPLLFKLLQVPTSRIKTTLDQEMPSLQSSHPSWDFLVTSLFPSSSDKARLVLILIFYSSFPFHQFFNCVAFYFIWRKIKLTRLSFLVAFHKTNLYFVYN